jgi:class 3 adenylate cyclase
VARIFDFIDLCGFTDFVESAGDEAGVDELQALRAAVREVTPLFGVRVEKWLGDGVMLVGVEPDALVGATLAIDLRFKRIGELPLRGGIATGAVLLLEGDDYVGQAVNLAARLCDLAGRDELLAATDALELPAWVIADDRPPVIVKGMAEVVRVAALRADHDELRRRSRARSASALLAVLDGLTRPLRR